jgi:uncharacterized membrane protein YfcA
MSLEPWQWVIAALGALLVGVSKTGIAGLGMVFVALFANILPTKQASGVVLPLLLFGDIVAVLAYRRHTQWRFLIRLFPWTACGVIVGWLAMDRINDRQADLMIGSIILALTALHLWRRRQPDSPPDHGHGYAALVGLLAGFTTLVANAAGPLMALYLLAMRLPKLEFVGTGAVFFLILNLFKVPFMIELGLVNAASFSFNLLLAPAVLLGALLGRWILPRINQRLFEALALAFGAAAAIRLLL